MPKKYDPTLTPKRRTRIVPMAILAGTLGVGAAVLPSGCGGPGISSDGAAGDGGLADQLGYPRDVSAHAFDIATPNDRLQPVDMAGDGAPADLITDLRPYPVDVSAHGFDLLPADLTPRD